MTTIVPNLVTDKNYLLAAPIPDKDMHEGWLIYVPPDNSNPDPQTYEVLPMDSGDPLLIPAKNIADGTPRTFTATELFISTTPGRKIPIIIAPDMLTLKNDIEKFIPDPVSAPSTSVPENFLKRADKVIDLVSAVDKLLEDMERRCLNSVANFDKTKAVIHACESVSKNNKYEEHIGKSWYYDYKKELLSLNGDRIALANSFHRSNYGTTIFSKTALHFVDTFVMRYFARRENRKKRDTIYEMARGMLKRTKGLWLDPDKCVGGAGENVVEELLNPDIPIDVILDNPEKRELLSPAELPSETWLYRYLHWFRYQPDQGESTIAQRWGYEFLLREYLTFDSFVRKASRPLQYVFADHCYLDIILVDEKDRKVTYRIWITVLIDAFTRCVIGFSLHPEYPNIMAVQEAIKNATWPKKKLYEELELEPSTGFYDLYGLPLSISFDNAWAHFSLSLQNLCRFISFKGKYNNIELIFRPPYKARYGALIERLFGNLQAIIKEFLPGVIISHDPQGILNAAKEACFLEKDIKKHCVLIFTKYNNTPHSELNGMSPYQKWQEGLGSGRPRPPSLTLEVERLFWRADPGTRVIGNEGISAFGMNYISPELSLVEKIDKDGRKVKYSFSYDPNNISCIALFRDGRFVCDVFAKELMLQDESYLQVSILERDLAKKIAKSLNKDSEDWLDYIKEVKKLTEIRMKEKEGNKGSSKPKASTKPSTGNVIPTGQEEEEYTNLAADFFK